MERKSSAWTALAQTAIFRGLAEADLSRLAEGAVRHSYRRGEIIMREDGELDCALLLTKGRARGYHLLPNAKISTLFLIGAGDLVPAVPSNTAIDALVDHTLVLRVRRTCLLWVERSSPLLAERVETLLSRRLRDAYDLIEDLMSGDVRTRLAHLLARLTESDGDPIAITREDLGSMTGDSRQTVTAALASFLAEGWIEYAPRAREIRIVNRQALANYPDSLANVN